MLGSGDWRTKPDSAGPGRLEKEARDRLGRSGPTEHATRSCPEHRRHPLDTGKRLQHDDPALGSLGREHPQPENILVMRRGDVPEDRIGCDRQLRSTPGSIDHTSTGG